MPFSFARETWIPPALSGAHSTQRPLRKEVKTASRRVLGDVAIANPLPVILPWAYARKDASTLPRSGQPALAGGDDVVDRLGVARGQYGLEGFAGGEHASQLGQPGQ